MVSLENKELPNKGQLILNDITNQITITNHKVLREAAQRDLEDYTKKMVNQINKGRKRLNHYEINDLIRIFILKIDRFDVDQPILPYKILKIILKK